MISIEFDENSGRLQIVNREASCAESRREVIGTLTVTETKSLITKINREVYEFERSFIVNNKRYSAEEAVKLYKDLKLHLRKIGIISDKYDD